MIRIDRDRPAARPQGTFPSFSALAAFAIAAQIGLAGVAAAQLLPPPFPVGNPPSAAKERLGKVLFWDEQISSPRTVACGTCHIPRLGGADPRSNQTQGVHPSTDELYGTDDDVFGSPGVPLADSNGLYQWNTHFGIATQVTHRRTVSTINAGYATQLFWDGRAEGPLVDPVTGVAVPGMNGGPGQNAALENQVLGPPPNDVEMGHQGRVWIDVLARITDVEPLALAHDVPVSLLQWIGGRSYAQLFQEAFGSADITATRVAMAIAAYERTQFTNRTPFDDFLLGNDGAMTPQEHAGRAVFTSASCDRCHSLEITSDHLFHYIGVRPAAEDRGRFEVTANNADLGRFRTPSLRNVELRAPYMHTGRFGTLEDVIAFYNRGGDFDEPNKDPLVRELNLTVTQRQDLLAFLTRPLTDQRLAEGRAPFDRPHLFTESGRVPVIETTGGVAGSGGLVPAAVAIEPALRGNPTFTVAVRGALGGANALLVIDDTAPGTSPPASGELVFQNVTLGGTGAGNGFGSYNFSIPNDTLLEGRTFFGRWYVTDGGAAGGRAVSPLFRFTVFGPLADSVMHVDDFESGNTARWSADFP